MTSEKYELAQDELGALLEQLQGSVGGIGAAQGEARKRCVQVLVCVRDMCTGIGVCRYWCV